MMHWDLSPGETIRVVPPSGDRSRDHGIPLVFKFRDTRTAFFVSPRDPSEGIEMKLHSKGDLVDGAGRRWEIIGRRNTRQVIKEPVGEYPNFTTAAGGGR